ncbi:putative transposase [Paeniglutamicibacter psychrophenolicus]|uniref:putative transposase n=1 Tax=Paeniglutamicibacter psychrophenolicus TaxID=257454 RepID=UPI002788682F|nr:hypothetical protein [Paeniglutamicibacter psychrophenolicus]MDQ0095970.1 transposase-like protein [Paeniglutamicibacter psychrophenolicus]
MTAQSHLPFAVVPDSLRVSDAVELVDTPEGGQVFVHGNLHFVWDANDAVARRFAAAKLVAIKAAPVSAIAAAFGVSEGTLWNWGQALGTGGVAALIPETKGPKRNSKLTDEVITRIHALRAEGLSKMAIGRAVGVSDFSVTRALAMEPAPAAAPAAAETAVREAPEAPASLPVLPEVMPRATERFAASIGGGHQEAPRFEPASRIPYVGLFLALPALEPTKLLPCAEKELGNQLKPGFYGLETILLEAVFRALAGEPRTEGATRLDPEGFGRILGLDRAPEVKTLRRRHREIADTDKVGDLLEAMAFERFQQTKGPADGPVMVLYVDGHTRAYTGGKKIGKLHSTRLKFPAPATEETWVSDANGDPVMVVMAEPGSSLVKEIRRLLPELRKAIGDDRRVLVGFDRGGWSPELFADMEAAGFDSLTWRKGTAEDVGEKLFGTVTHIDDHGQTRQWKAADTTVDFLLSKATGRVVTMRQISRIVPLAKGSGTRQIHILTTLREPGAGELIYTLGARWRQENYFRYAREHFALDAHPGYGSHDDDPERSVPNPAKDKSHQAVLAARAHHEKMNAIADAALLAANTPPEGATGVLVTNEAINAINAPVNDAHAAVEKAEAAHKKVPGRLPLGEVNPGQQVLETRLKQFTHLIGMSAYTISMSLAGDVRTNTGYRSAHNGAHALVRKILTQPGDIDPTVPGYLDITLDPLPTGRETAAAAELCEHLTETETPFPGTDRILRFAVRERTRALD